MDKQEAIRFILDFMATVSRCRSETTYAQDRRLYTSDLANAAEWLVQIHQGMPITEVKRRVLSSQTEKAFSDYWRQGKWGELESEALQVMRNAFKNSG